MNTCSISWWVSRPPPPCPIRTRACWLIGSGARGAGNHGGHDVSPFPPATRCARDGSGSTRRRRPPFDTMVAPSGCSGVQRVPKAGHSCGFIPPLQDQAADALRRFLGPRDSATPKRCSASKRAVVRAQAQAARRDLADAAPLSWHHLEHLAHQLLRRAGCPSRRTARAYWFSTSARPSSSCSTHM